MPETMRPRPASRSSLLASLPAGLVEERYLHPCPSLWHHSCGLISHRESCKALTLVSLLQFLPLHAAARTVFHNVRVVVSVMIKPSSGFPEHSEDIPDSFLRSTKAYIIWPGPTATSPSTSPVLPCCRHRLSSILEVSPLVAPSCPRTVCSFCLTCSPLIPM